jgi:hypothetical protein
MTRRPMMLSPPTASFSSSCIQKNVKVDDVNNSLRKQAEHMCAASATYYQAIAEQTQRETNTLWFRYEDLVGKIKYICIKSSAGLLLINHQRIRNPRGDLTHASVHQKEEAGLPPSQASIFTHTSPWPQARHRARSVRFTDSDYDHYMILSQNKYRFIFL